METLVIPLVRLDADLPVPACAYVGDAGVDLRATCDLELAPFERALVPCGIAVAIPLGCAGLVVPRSGLAIKHGISLVNAPGLQRGSVRVERAVFEPCKELPASERGEGGFGSSGVSS